ncbi:hypothetical protein BY996DRAFT_6819014 [Phakopsora pachyrhizi]|uniref:Expressed protein n=1 Tax=Phakopsora pachyrhizi TaxID=170000 RepID=A0AAV0AUM0_PHAPC|nr:hypothetical protein BY996DRAFT_6819014 [Phakopsora pachyrhizi]CAH7671401.1 expressed protein [Phakopsora pachyrhizi]
MPESNYDSLQDSKSASKITTNEYLTQCANSMTEELNLLSRLIYLNKNQHRNSKWYKKCVEAYRWSRRIIKLFSKPLETKLLMVTLSEFQARLLKGYESIIQIIARSAFMASGMCFVGSLARLYSISRCSMRFLENLKKVVKAIIKEV